MTMRLSHRVFLYVYNALLNISARSNHAGSHGFAEVLKYNTDVHNRRRNWSGNGCAQKMVRRYYVRRISKIDLSLVSHQRIWLYKAMYKVKLQDTLVSFQFLIRGLHYNQNISWKLHTTNLNIKLVTSMSTVSYSCEWKRGTHIYWDKPIIKYWISAVIGLQLQVNDSLVMVKLVFKFKE